jgi:hypothetical protein
MLRWYPAVISTLAFSYQVFVLEPWHQRISDELHELKEAVKKTQSTSGRVQ